MLSRVADSLYWINRYLERAENISRFLEVSEAMALDCPPGSAEPWLPLVEVTGDRQRFDTAYPEIEAENQHVERDERTTADNLLIGSLDLLYPLSLMLLAAVRPSLGRWTQDGWTAF